MKNSVKNSAVMLLALFIIFGASACEKTANLNSDISLSGQNSTTNSSISEQVNPNDLSYLLSDDETYYSVFRCLFSATKVEIPSTHKGLPVAKISDYAFSQCEKLTSVSIPDSVTEIGNGAFTECENLKNIYIGTAVSKIGSFCFNDCIKLESINVAPGNENYISSGTA